MRHVINIINRQLRALRSPHVSVSYPMAVEVQESLNHVNSHHSVPDSSHSNHVTDDGTNSPHLVEIHRETLASNQHQTSVPTIVRNEYLNDMLKHSSTMKELYDEWTSGRNGLPSVMHLNNIEGNTWRKKDPMKKRYYRRVNIILCIENIAERRQISGVEVAMRLDALNTSRRSLDWISKHIGKRDDFFSSLPDDLK